MCVCMCVAEKEYIDHNLKSVSVGTNILFLRPCVTHTFSFHLSLTHIPLCNCALIFQCQSGLCPQPYYLLHSQLFSFIRRFSQFPYFYSHSRYFFPLDLFCCCCCVPLVNMCVCACVFECLFVPIQL